MGWNLRKPWLEYSVDKRKFLIRRSAEEAEGVRQEEEQANVE